MPTPASFTSVATIPAPERMWGIGVCEEKKRQNDQGTGKRKKERKKKRAENMWGIQQLRETQ
jgi:hypothetical protein